MPKNNLFLEKENKNLYVLNDDYNIQNHIKGVFQLFHKWSQEYNYNQLYSKETVFKIINHEPQKRKNMADNMRKRIKSYFCSKILKNLNEMLEPLNLKFCNIEPSNLKVSISKNNLSLRCCINSKNCISCSLRLITHDCNLMSNYCI